MVHGNVEETLDSVLVQIDGYHVVHARCRQQIGHQFGANGFARGRLTVLTRIAVVCNNGAHSMGGSALRGIGHDEQLHECVIHVVVVASANRLHQKHVGPTHAFKVTGVNFAVRELLKPDITKRDIKFGGNVFRQLVVHRT